MSKLQVLYSKEIARQLGKIAVYLPGTPIEVGDIITFPHGKSFLGKPRPLGTFQKITSLKKIGVQYTEPEFSNAPDTYQFSSENSVGFNFDTNMDMDLGDDNLPSGNGKVRISFSSEGAIYFLGVDCDKKQLDDLTSLENEINGKGKKLLWKDTYLVTSVTIAKKAFIVQSRSKSSEITIQGHVKGINTRSTNIKANGSLGIEKQKGDIFIKDWSDHVTVFMELIRFEKEIFGGIYKGKEIMGSSDEGFRIHLKPVQIEELLDD